MAVGRRKAMGLLFVAAIISLSITIIVLFHQISSTGINISTTFSMRLRQGDDRNDPYEIGSDQVEVEPTPVDWNFTTPKRYEQSVLSEWTEAKAMVNHEIIPGNGENGEAFTRVDSSNAEMQRLLKEHNYNLMATEMMSLHRSLPDYRCDECKAMVYPKKLPKTSFILIFHNEAWSLILRTVWSIIERSPRELIEEIILVDDVSTWPELGRALDDYIQLLPARIRLIRNKKREGLIRSRLIGAEIAKGQVLVFFDAHIEVTAGWLEPLLANIAEDRSLVAVPHIDWISSSTMKFDASESYQFSRYSWALGLFWTDIPERERIRTNHSKTALIRLPMHVGCAFAIDRDFFYEIGSYDEGMDIWGSENLDLALRAWMCGGSLQLVQCSRIGHFYRISTYSFEGDKGEIMARNDKRVAEVWMDDYKYILYEMKQYLKKIDAGDLTERMNLKKRLQCKSYQWYLENIYPENRQWHKFIALGAIKNVAGDMCIDIDEHKEGEPIELYSCHNNGGNQFLAVTEKGLIITYEDKYCIGVKKQNSTTVPTTVECADNNKSQLWKYNTETKLIEHIDSGLCLQSVANAGNVVLGACNENDKKCQWLLNNL